MSIFNNRASPVVRKHILLVPLPAYGHMIPLLELGKKLGQFHDVTFAVSKIRVADLKKRDFVADCDPLTLYAIEDGITTDIEVSGDEEARNNMYEAISTSFIQLMLDAPTTHEPAKSTIFKPVDVIIVDSFHGVPVATGVPYYLFNAANGSCWRSIMSLNEDTPIVDDKDAPFMLLPESGKPPHGVQAMGKQIFLPLKKSTHLATGVITDSLREIETESIAELEKEPAMIGLTHHFVGPLFPEEKWTNSDNQAMEAKIHTWLQSKSLNSVVYVSFGSLVAPSDEQITVIGEALLSLGKIVIWSLKEKQQQFLPEALRQKILTQFEDADCKILIVPWVPQKLILTHPAVGVFVTHGGWNSTLEGLSGGKPFVVYPMFGDQLLNGQWIEKSGAGVLLPDTRLTGGRVVPAKEFNEAIRKVGGWKGNIGEDVSKYRETAQVWQSKMRDAWTPSGSSYIDLMNLVRFE